MRSRFGATGHRGRPGHRVGLLGGAGFGGFLQGKGPFGPDPG